MAELLLTDPWSAADPIGVQNLRETLPDDHIVVAAPTVRQRLMEAIVIGPTGLTILAQDTATAAVRPTQPITRTSTLCGGFCATSSPRSSLMSAAWGSVRETGHRGCNMEGNEASQRGQIYP